MNRIAHVQAEKIFASMNRGEAQSDAAPNHIGIGPFNVADQRQIEVALSFVIEANTKALTSVKQAIAAMAGKKIYARTGSMGCTEGGPHGSTAAHGLTLGYNLKAQLVLMRSASLALLKRARIAGRVLLEHREWTADIGSSCGANWIKITGDVMQRVFAADQASNEMQVALQESVATSNCLGLLASVSHRVTEYAQRPISSRTTAAQYNTLRIAMFEHRQARELIRDLPPAQGGVAMSLYNCLGDLIEADSTATRPPEAAGAAHPAQPPRDPATAA